MKSFEGDNNPRLRLSCLTNWLSTASPCRPAILSWSCTTARLHPAGRELYSCFMAPAAQRVRTPQKHTRKGMAQCTAQQWPRWPCPALQWGSLACRLSDLLIKSKRYWIQGEDDAVRLPLLSNTAIPPAAVTSPAAWVPQHSRTQY